MSNLNFALRDWIQAVCFAIVLIVPSIGAIQHSPLGNGGVVVHLAAALPLSVLFYLYGGNSFVNRLSGEQAKLLGLVFLGLISIATIIAMPLANAGMLPGAHNRDESLNLAVSELLHGTYPSIVFL